MDPTQNNDSFGSLSSGGGNPVPGAGGVSGASAGATGATATGVSAGAAGATGASGAAATGVPAGPAGVPGSTGMAGVPAGIPSSGMPAGIPSSGMPVGAAGSNPGMAAGAVSSSATPGVNGVNPAVLNNFGQTNLNPNSNQTGAVFSQVNMGMPISSGTGDVVVGGSQKQNRKKMLLVGGLIALVVLIVVGLVVSVALGGKTGSGGGGQAGSQGLKGAFNSYANYVMFGKDSDEDLTEDEMNEYGVYFVSLGKDETALYKYTNEVNRKFDVLKNSLSGDDPYWSLALSNLSDYFQKYPNVQPLTVGEITDAFNKSGRSGAEALIDSRYSTSDASSSGEDISSRFLDYLIAASDLSVFQLDIIEKASVSGCVLNDQLESDCYVLTEEESQTFDEYVLESFDAEGALMQNAILALWDIYDEAYGIKTEEEGDAQGGEEVSGDSEGVSTNEGSEQ
ncbi:hypothetical protein J5491_03320 [Candidatus Saccharibacteria bacterium]|nr:hypothetical protein [Candidatus Saccharibacteria bacterium]